MLHPRYHNYWSCLYHTHREEGFKGLYRGFPPHLLATALCAAIIPYLAEVMLSRSQFYGVTKHSKNDELHDEVIEGKKRIESKRK
jgi:hypothetical protein